MIALIILGILFVLACIFLYIDGGAGPTDGGMGGLS